MSRRMLVVLALTLLALAACTRQVPDVTLNDQLPAAQRTEPADAEGGGEGGEAPADGPVVVFEAEQLEFVAVDPNPAPAGQLTVELVNHSGLPHNVVFVGVAGEEPVAEDAGGGTARGTVTLEPGTYTYYCSVPGHREAGMEGDLQVS